MTEPSAAMDVCLRVGEPLSPEDPGYWEWPGNREEFLFYMRRMSQRFYLDPGCTDPLAEGFDVPEDLALGGDGSEEPPREMEEDDESEEEEDDE